ncbi:MAG: ThuA domain-containing protein, partial [Pirellulaceae bacterium]
MPNRKTLLVVLALCTCLGLSLAQGAEKPRDEKIRVLLITGGHDYEEKQFHAAFEAIPDVTTVTATLPEAAAQLTPELADKIDVIVFYDMWVAGFSPEQQQAFVALLNRGIGVLALHHTLAAHQEWPEYAKIIGGKYQT